MMRKAALINIVGAITAVFLFVGCQSSDGNDSSEPPPETLRYRGPKPEEGTGNVYGAIWWNGAGAKGLDVLLCPDYSSFSGCSGEMVTAVTEADGTFLLANVQPGTYALTVRVFNSDNWLTINDGILSTADFVVEAGETLVIEPQSIYKLDLQPQKPRNGDSLKSGSAIFNWERYPDAAYYQIYLTPDKGEAIFVNNRVDNNQITAELPPVNCDYRWSLEAFSSKGIKIAETEDFIDFQVVGEEASCILQINGPVDGEFIPASGIVLNWEANPLAASYKILMWDDTDPDKTNILDFHTVTESQFVFNGALIPDHRYVWSVYAYANDGKEVASSEIFDFTVTP